MIRIDRNTKNQLSYIAEAAFEYFIAILTSGVFLASILGNIGVPDSVTGIISTLTSLGFSAQLVAVLFIRPRGSVKKLVTTMNVVNQLMFAVLYIIPYISVPRTVKIAVFVVMLLGGNLISNAASPFKFTWLMSYVFDRDRGKFTANKEIVSLIGGMGFSYVMGAVIDHYKALGKAETAFIISGITLFVLTIIHLVSLLCVKDDEDAKTVVDKPFEKHSIGYVFGCTVLDKSFRKIILLDIIWHIGNGISVSFFGTYQINELGFTLSYVAILSAFQSLVRVAFSRFFGKIADRTSWARMLMIAISVGAVGFLVNTFTAPSNGKWMFVVYGAFNAAYLAGANSGMSNIVFDYVTKENRSYALGVKAALGGIAGFLASLLGAWVVSFVQSHGNSVFGVTVYAQQILSFVSFVVFVGVVVYIKFVVMKLKNLH
ncbi:MAG: MFS transporter [Ruminococcaceae bacterium]|nr:MFS transporter [Oscillospiraceae bacterium]